MQIRFRYLSVIGILSLFLVVSGKHLCAQEATDFRFNEILINNTSNFMDDYGNRGPWVELINTSYSNINIAGCYLTDDRNNLTKYWIPTDSPTTLIEPRGFVLFFGSERPSQSIYHLNFNLEEGETIYLVNGNGKDIIDELKIPNIPSDQAYSCSDLETNTWKLSNYPTPLANNDHSRRASAGELFVEHDPWGLGMVFIAMAVVFSVLAILTLFYLFIGRIFTRKVILPTTVSETSKPEKSNPNVLSGEINAAIALTLYQYINEIQEYEKAVLTINKTLKPYSPWNSKLQMMTKVPNRK
ncbi:MAG: OadG family transporter subunit [Mangrovibacterium sp.]